ncbi:hypothetical protein DFH06DRAFT_1133444 [Mycena polygramma]|nr:hypothetical protein DFH06DRAFT_1133444 [Mycena polygramma]
MNEFSGGRRADSAGWTQSRQRRLDTKSTAEWEIRSRTLRPSISELRRPFAPAWTSCAVLDSAQTESSSATRVSDSAPEGIPIVSTFCARDFLLCSLNTHSALLNRMPHNMDPYAASLLEETRKKTMAALCRLAARAPIEAAEAYLNLRPYKERPGFVYTHLRPNWEVLDDAPNVPVVQLDWVDIKVGKAEDMEDRQLGYESTCVGEPIAWAFCYETSRPKLIERLTHLTLWEMGAKRVPYACRGCGVHHREHFSEAVSGGLEIVALIIEYWMRKIGEQPTRILLDD